MTGAFRLLAQATSDAGDAAAAGTATASGGVQETFEFGRFLSFGIGSWVLLLLAVIAVFAVVIYFYLRDSVELGRFAAVILVVLRLGVFGCLLFIYAQPQFRQERDMVLNSRVILLLDTSLSMAKSEDEDSKRSRVDAIVETLTESSLIEDLRKVHDVVVLSFDTENDTVATLGKISAAPTQPGAKSQPPPDWRKLLTPQGRETRLGQSLRQVINDERAKPLAGIVLVTDGQHNAGVDPAVAIRLARDAEIPVYPVGVGSAKQDVYVRVADFQVPARAYPGDDYSVIGVVQATGMANQEAAVDLYIREASAPAEAAELVQTEMVGLGADGEKVVVRFALTPDEEPGRRMLTLRVRPPTPSVKPTKEMEDEKVIEIVDRQTRVLLFAGGPMREYRFLRNQLRRDESMVVDVCLQSAQPGISQDANKVLDEFPTSKEDLFEYDCIVGFDPDWQELDEEQIEMLEEWVAKAAGGLIVIPGPVNTDDWVHNDKETRLAKIRDLYPVHFKRHFAVLDDSEFDNTQAFPIKFTDDGMDAEYLWLDDSQISSDKAWSEFEGVYGYYSVRGPKEAATVLANFSDPEADDGNGLPPYLVFQFYGAGRVFYMGSGEMWRIRAFDEAHFETFYTKLIRYVSQGTLLRGSKRGMLLVEQDNYMLGDTVSVRAQLQDGQFEPLAAESVVLEVVGPDDRLHSVSLNAIATNPGTFAGQFTVYQEGNYRLQLPVPESEEVLNWAIDVRLPDLENENTQRNDPLLSEIATATDGQYYVGLTPAIQGPKALPVVLTDHKRTITLSDEPKTLWDQTPILFVVCGLLCLEWLIRRLNKLA